MIFEPILNNSTRVAVLTELHEEAKDELNLARRSLKKRGDRNSNGISTSFSADDLPMLITNAYHLEWLRIKAEIKLKEEG